MPSALFWLTSDVGVCPKAVLRTTGRRQRSPLFKLEECHEHFFAYDLAELWIS